jgi:hypothetical protein
MARELYIIAGGLLAWIGLVELRKLDCPGELQKLNGKTRRLRRLAGCLISFLGFCLALYGAW